MEGLCRVLMDPTKFPCNRTQMCLPLRTTALPTQHCGAPTLARHCDAWPCARRRFDLTDSRPALAHSVCRIYCLAPRRAPCNGVVMPLGVRECNSIASALVSTWMPEGRPQLLGRWYTTSLRRIHLSPSSTAAPSCSRQSGQWRCRSAVPSWGATAATRRPRL